MEENISEPNLSDLIDVIMNDMKGDIVQGGSYVGGGDNTSTSTHPIIEIVEQPKLKVRFRYECEGRSAGSILGANSTNDTKSYPAIKIRNHKGSAIVVVSCVTKDEPYRPHPHKLVGKENCENGIYTIQFSNEGDTKLPFTNLGIQCMKKKDIDESLKKRQELNVDPFKTGFAHRTQISTINLNAVRLCFQAFLPLSDNKFEKLRPVVSDPIYDSKSNSDLVIHTLSHVSAPVAGGMKMILLCDKVTKEDIKIRFFEVQGDNVVWEGYGDFQPQDVHKQFAIVFKTPTYKNLQITEPVNIHIQLVNSKKSYSEPYNFKFTPLDSEDDLRRKRQKKSDVEYFHDLENNLDPELRKRKWSQVDAINSPVIKTEPPDQSPHHQYHSIASSPCTNILNVPGPSGEVSFSTSPRWARSTSPYQTPVTYQSMVTSPEDMYESGAMQVDPSTQLYQLSPQQNVSLVDPSQHRGVCEGGVGERNYPFGVVTNLDTQETHPRRQEDTLNEIGANLSEVNTEDLMDPSLPASFSGSLNISDNRETNYHSSGSITNILNQTANNIFGGSHL